LNPRPLGYEPYDTRLCRLGPSLTGVVTSADRTDQISLRRLRPSRLVLSRRVRFTNRFTKQAIDLQLPAPFPPFRGCHPSVRCTVSGLAKQLASGMALTRATCRLRSRPTPGRGALVVITAAGLHRGTGRAVALPRPLPRTRPDGRRVLSRVGAADHAVTPEAPWTGSGWREYSYGGFGGGHPHFHRYTGRRKPNLGYRTGERRSQISGSG